MAFNQLLARSLTRTLSRRADEGFPAVSTFDPATLFSAGEKGAIYDFSDLSTVYQERTGGGTTLSSINGVIGTIRDKSGNGNHWPATSDAARPILRQSGSTYFAEFDGVDDRLFLNWPVAIATPLTRASCIKQNTWGAGRRLFHANVSTSYLGQNNVTPQLATFNGTSWGAINSGAALGSAAVVVERFGTSGSSGYGMTINSGTETTHTGTYASHVSITTGDGSLPSDTRYYAVIIIDRALTSPELADVKSWLASKAEVSL